ncbi:hypothetical protein M8818_000048 [Zalaria obscura]|uniref:Uncharacterized protein n=1 Tax=Zalaria obscura TaxID=2024903 RepID=A0ACC3SNH8_9PEZI
MKASPSLASAHIFLHRAPDSLPTQSQTFSHPAALHSSLQQLYILICTQVNLPTVSPQQARHFCILSTQSTSPPTLVFQHVSDPEFSEGTLRNDIV